MNYGLYLFGTNKGTYIQYPSDGEEVFLKPLCVSVKGSQLTVYQKEALTHYAFFRQLGSESSQIFGICIVTNGVHFKEMKVLYQAFDKMFYRIVFSGKILRLTGTGIISYLSDNFASDKESVEQAEVLIRDIIKEDLEPYAVHTRQNFSGLISTTTIALEERNSEILSVIEQNNVVHIYSSDNANSSLNYVEQTVSSLYKENSQLKADYSKLQSQKRQYRNVLFLLFVILACSLGLYYFYNDANDKAEHIRQLEKTITKKNAAIEERDHSISELQNSINDLHDKIGTISSYKLSTGSTIRNSDNQDNAWILWIKARQKIQIESFYIKSQTSGNVDIGLFDTNDNLIASVETYVYEGEFRKVIVDTEWTIDRGAYYMKIRSGVSLQYHSSNDGEYGQFSGGALEVTGACNYSERNDETKKSNHSYYQYFYNIRYHIVVDVK